MVLVVMIILLYTYYTLFVIFPKITPRTTMFVAKLGSILLGIYLMIINICA